MFATPLRKSERSVRPEQSHPYELFDRSYGKDGVRIVHVTKNGPVQTLQQFEVGVHLKLHGNREYVHGINADIICSESQKDTVYLMAKKHGIESPEGFALTLARHYIKQYAHVDAVNIHIEAHPWQRISQENTTQLHNHAFISSPTAIHYCDAILKRNDPHETVISGIKGLRAIKTTQASFEKFFVDEFRTLPDQADRIFSVGVDCTWEYSDVKSVNFLEAWNTVKNTVLQCFAGDPVKGIHLTSSQHLLYDIEKAVLDALPQVFVVSMTMHNNQCFRYDTKPFQHIVPGDNYEVFVPADKPHSTVCGKLTRDELNSHL